VSKRSKRFRHAQRTAAGRASSGPLKNAGFGNGVVLQNAATAEHHIAMQKELRDRYPKVVAEIDGLVEQIAAQVSQLPPAQLLQHAWWATAKRRSEVEAESELGLDDGTAQRMIDYVQSVIASVPRDATQRSLEEVDWNSLAENVEKLFLRVNFDLPLCATAKAQESADFDPDVEEFKVKAQMYWCNVRGHRYQVHEPVYLREMFLPHSSVFQELFGISAEQFVEQMTKLLRNLAQGIIGNAGDVESFRRDVLVAVEAKLASGVADETDDADENEGPDDARFGRLMAAVIKENGWEKRAEDVIGRSVGTDAFDVQLVAGLPQSLLDHMTWTEGEETEFLAPGEMRGWPLRVWPVFRRPFIKIDGRYYCFDHYSLFDSLYRAMQRIIQGLRPDYRQPWNEIQARVAEELPFKYLTVILPGSTVFRSVYYPIGNGQWAEADGLLLFEDYLFVVEVKAGAFTLAPPASDFPSYITSLERLVLAPASQGRRFLTYLKSADAVPIYDAAHTQIGQLRHAEFRLATICGVTLDPLTELAAQVQHLRKIGVDVGSDPVWSVSVDDLRVYADVFGNPLEFVHFLEQRMVAFRSDVVELEDELDHLGLYLEHNHYATYASERRGGATTARLTFGGYRDRIDRFFQARFFDPLVPSPLKQSTPARLQEIVDALAARPPAAGRARLSSSLLDWGGAQRERIAAWIDEELAKQPTTRRPLPLSTRGAAGVTLFCWSPIVQRNAASGLEQARTVLLMNQEQRRLLLELSYGTQGQLVDVTWTWVDRAEIPAVEMPRLEKAAEELRRTRTTGAAAISKVGRNAPCPCGSTRKLKKCCLGR